MTHAAPGDARSADAPSNSPESDDRPAAERGSARDAARHVAGRLRSLPRLAAAGAARARDAVGGRVDALRDGGSGGALVGSDAERTAHRRELALAAAEAGPGTDWARVGVFSAGLAVGALIGAGAALLLAPASGFETRTRLARQARRSGGRAVGRLDEMSEGARRGAKRGARRVGRAVTSARWAAEDAWERRRER
jgi:hypothetical protein